MNLFVGNLAYQTTSEDLQSAFGAFGAVSSAAVIMDKFSGQSKGFGFVEMPSNSEADQAIKALNGKPMHGRPLKVNTAQPRGAAPARRR